MDNDVFAVTLDIAGDGAGAHMTVEAEDRITDIVVMRHFYVVEDDHVLQFARIADDTIRTDQGRAAHKSAVAHLGMRPDDAWRTKIGTRKDMGRLMDPDMFRNFVIFIFRKMFPQRENQILDAVQ